MALRISGDGMWLVMDFFFQVTVVLPPGRSSKGKD